MKTRLLLHIARWFNVSALALLLGSCGSDSGSSASASGGDGGLGGEANSSGGSSSRAQGGSGASSAAGATGSGGTDGRPSYSPCPDFGAEYDGNGCSEACSSVGCECSEDFPFEVSVCHSTLGCLTELDCDVACGKTLSLIVNCAQGEGDCLRDDECAGFCVGESSAEVGECSAGALGDPCVDADDCALGRCNDSVCTGDAPLGSDCAQGFECASLHCFAMECVSGEVGQACTDDEHCEGMCGGGFCTEGEIGQSCGGPDSCKSGLCARGEFAHAVCSGGSLGESCNGDEDCASGRCRSAAPNCGGGSGSVCVAGAKGERCCDETNCESGLCVRSDYGVSPASRECTEGQLGDLCNDDADGCTEGYCVRDVCTQTAPSKCLDGSAGERCCTDDDCVSGACDRVDPFDSATWVCEVG